MASLDGILDAPRKPGGIPQLGTEHHVAALHVRLNVRQSERFVKTPQRLHANCVVPGQVDSAKQSYGNGHAAHP